MKPKHTSDNRVIYDNLSLDEQLFYFEDSKQKSISPAAAFKPAGALDGQAFQNSTSPSAELKKKTLIIDKSTLTKDLPNGYKQNPSEALAHLVGVLKRLQIAGFEIFLCGNSSPESGNKFHKLEDNLSNISLLLNLSEFDQNKDYEELAKLGLARDKTFHFSNFKQIDNCLDHRPGSRILNSDLYCDELNFCVKKIPATEIEDTNLALTKKIKSTTLRLRSGIIKDLENEQDRAQKINLLVKLIALKDHLQIAAVDLNYLDANSACIFLSRLNAFKSFEDQPKNADYFNENHASYAGKEFNYQEIQGIKKLRESIRFFNFGKKTQEESQEITNLVNEIYKDEKSRPLFDFKIIEKQASQPLNPTSNSDQTQLKKGEIRIAQNDKLSESLGVENSSQTPTYQMALAGEVLNCDLAEPKIRTCVIEQNILKNLGQKQYFPQNFEKIEDFKSLDETKINGFKTQNSAQNIYCKFSQQITANQQFRLLSADAHEKLVGIIGNKDGLEIKRGEDDFFYATSTSDRILEFVVQAPNPNSYAQNYNQILANNPIKKIIDEYRDVSKGFTKLASKDKEDVKYNAQNHQESMQRMFDEKLGVCRHRVAAVSYVLSQNPQINKADFRVLRINNNHVILEIKHDNKWIGVDLGGVAPNKINLGDDKIFAPEADKKTEPSLADLADLANNSGKTNETNSANSLNLNSKPSQEDLEKASLAIMAKELLAFSSFEEVGNEDDLTKKLSIPKNKNSLVKTKTIEQHANFLLEQAKQQSRQIFYIDSPAKIDLHRINLRIANDNFSAREANATLTNQGLLSDFLTKSKEQKSGQNPIILINWDAFLSKEKVALNTILDSQRKINGVEIDDSIQVVGLSGADSQDPSFLSRHNLKIESKINLPEISAQTSDFSKTIKVDLMGFSDWKSQLFGKVILLGEKMVWKSKSFVEDLKSYTNFEFKNLSQEAAAELKYEFEQARAKGKFVYHGFEIAFNPNLNFKFANQQFEFNKFNDSSTIKVCLNSSFDQAPQECALINPQLFDILLCDKKIEDGKYFEELGLIENCAKSSDKTVGKNLKLFISSQLPESQFYCLFEQAKTKGIGLELYLAPLVKIPNGVVFEEIQSQSTSPQKQKQTAQIIVSNNAQETLNKLKRVGDWGAEETKEPEIEIFATIDVEDFSYQDLVKKTDFQINQTGFSNFTKTQSQFLTQLKAGKKIVLKGEFSPDLLQMLEPIITSKEPEFTGVGENLILIIEDKNCQKSQTYEPLNWLAQNDYKVEVFEESQSPEFTDRVFIEEAPNQTTDLSQSQQEAENFIWARKRNFANTLRQNSMLRLIGHSGVGKSRLLKEFETDPKDNFSVYRELNAFENWANDKTDKTKILFIDESNIEDLHFTMFSPLKDEIQAGETKKIFYQGKFYDLGANHKVVFAQNPAEYGGGRFEQKLFDDGKIPAIHLRDFSASYIYEKILKNAIYDQLSEEIRNKNLSEEIFKDFAKPLIQEYQNSNANKKSEEAANQETVRELQEKMLQLVEQVIFKRDKQAITPNFISSFISTNATKEVEEALTNAISVRQKQREGVFPNKAVGLNGVLLEGDSGVGKSVLIEAVLASKGIKPATPENSASASESNLMFYKIDANLPLDQKKRIITKAFEEGNIVWIDEINSCIDDGLEKILNAALTGDHPEGKSVNVKPGFMLISSVNSAGLEGRSIISPALRHRTTQPRVKGLKEYEVEDLAKIISHWISQDEDLKQHQNSTQNHQKIAENFLKCLNSKGGERLNLRMLKSDLPKILTEYEELFPSQKINSEPKINSDDLKNSFKRGVEEALKKEGKISFTKASLGIKEEEKTITPQILNLEKLDQKLWYSEFGGLKFEENPKNPNDKIFGKAENLFFANFRGCTFENIDFSQIDSKILSTVNFKKCHFNNCKFDENFVFKNSQIPDFCMVNTKIKTEAANLHLRQQVPSNSFQPKALQRLSGIELSLERLRTTR